MRLATCLERGLFCIGKSEKLDGSMLCRDGVPTSCSMHCAGTSLPIWTNRSKPFSRIYNSFDSIFSAVSASLFGISGSLLDIISIGTLKSLGCTTGNSLSIGRDKIRDIHTALASALASVRKQGNFINPRQKRGINLRDSGRMSCPEDEDVAQCFLYAKSVADTALLIISFKLASDFPGIDEIVWRARYPIYTSKSAPLNTDPSDRVTGRARELTLTRR